jgi:hypothetical protein
MSKITTDMVENWEIENLASAIGNCLELNNDFLSRYCGKKIAAQLSRIPESEREYILQSHIGEGYSVHTIPTESDREIMLPVGEIEFQFEGQPSDIFENPDDFHISGDCAYLSCYGVYFPVDVDSLKSEIDEHLSGRVIDDIFDDFFSGYLRAAIFTGSHYPDPENMDDSRPMDSVYSPKDIPREIRAELESDCRDFLNHSGFMVTENPERAGMDFHFTRNGHGSGFWDGDWPEFGAELTARSRPCGTAELYSDPTGIYLHH